jgi:hypothetical protein
MDGCDVEVLPQWRAAADAFVEEGYGPGDAVPHSWFYERFGITEPTPDMKYGHAQKVELAYLENMTELKDYLLREHCIDLKSRHGFGYEVVPPQKQAADAYDRMGRRVRKEFRKAVERVTHVRVAELTTDQQKDRMDTLARIDAIRQMHSRARRLPSGS